MLGGGLPGHPLRRRRRARSLRRACPEDFLLTVGRLVPHKGADRAIAIARAARAAARHRRRRDAVPRRAATPFYEERVRPHVDGRARAALSARSRTPRSSRSWRARRAFLFPISWDEPFGLVVAEAMAAGTPVVATPRGSLPELVEHGVTGFLGETDEELADFVAPTPDASTAPPAAAAPRSGTVRTAWCPTTRRCIGSILGPMSFDFSPATLDREFPVRRNFVYFNHAAVAPLPRRVADAMIGARRERARPRRRGLARAVRRRSRRRARRRRASSARRAEEIAFLPEHVLGRQPRGARRSRGRKATTSSPTTWSSRRTPTPGGRSTTRGVECRVAKSRGGRITVDDLAARRATRARASSPSRGSRSTTAGSSRSTRSAALCRERGILFVVDAIQGLGALPMDVARARASTSSPPTRTSGSTAPRAARSSTSPRGARPRAGDRVRLVEPQDRGRTTSTTGRRRTRARAVTSRARCRSINVAGLAAAIDLLEEMGRDAVRARILGLVRRAARRARGARLADRLARAARLGHPRRRAALGRRALVGEGARGARRHRRAARRLPCASRPTPATTSARSSARSPRSTRPR